MASSHSIHTSHLPGFWKTHNNGFELLDCTVIKLKRPKVTGGEVGVSSNTVRARPIKIKLLINNLVYLETILLCKLYA